jgi:hypothetical protein
LSESEHKLKLKEYKLMLKPGEFIGIINGREKVINIIKSQIQNQGGTFDDTDQDEDYRKVWYLDTKKLELYEKNNFLLRIREEFKNNGTLKGYDVNLKNRNKNRGEALKYDLSNPSESSEDFKYEKFEFEFEEDVLMSFDSVFSASAKFEFKQQKPKLETWQHILSVFPDLNLDISSTESLLRVNGRIVKEFSYELGIIRFNDGNIANTEISLWYMSTEDDKNFELDSIKNRIPDIVEFDIDIESPTNNGTLSDEFPSSLLEETNTFYKALQNDPIADLSAKTTKTKFIYEYEKQE